MAADMRTTVYFGAFSLPMVVETQRVTLPQQLTLSWAVLISLKKLFQMLRLHVLEVDGLGYLLKVESL